MQALLLVRIVLSGSQFRKTKKKSCFLRTFSLCGGFAVSSNHVMQGSLLELSEGEVDSFLYYDMEPNVGLFPGANPLQEREDGFWLPSEEFPSLSLDESSTAIPPQQHSDSRRAMMLDAPVADAHNVEGPRPLLEHNSIVWLCLDQLKNGKSDRRNDKMLHAYVYGYKHLTPDQQRSHIKCHCFVQGDKLEDRLVIIGKETAKTSPCLILTKEGDLKVADGRCAYRAQLLDPEFSLKLQRGMVRPREARDEGGVHLDVGGDKMVCVDAVPREQKKLKGRNAAELLAELKGTVQEGSEMAKFFPLLSRMVQVLDGTGVGDTAYRHFAIQNQRSLEPRDIVGLVGDRLSLDLSQASFVSVVAYDDWVAAERNPRRVCDEKAALVVYMGRTQVKVHPLKFSVLQGAGTPLFVVPDGENNGIGRIVCAEEVDDNQHIVGLFGGYYQPPSAEIPYAIVDVVIFPSSDRPVVLSLLREIRRELAAQLERLSVVEETVGQQCDDVQELESRTSSCETEIGALSASHCEVTSVVMEMQGDLTEVRFSVVEMRGELDRVVEAQDENDLARIVLERKLLALEQDVAQCRRPSASCEFNELHIIEGLQRIYMALKTENALNELSMELSDDIYIKPQLYLGDGKKLTGDGALWSRIPAGDGPVMLLGDKGIGKSTFARYECAKWAKDSTDGEFGGYDFVFYVDFSVVFTKARLGFWMIQSMVSLESVQHMYFQVMRNRMDCFSELPSEELLRRVRTRSRCCYIFDGFDSVESYEAPAVQEFMDDLRLGKHRGFDYMLLCSALLGKDKIQPRAEITISGFEDSDVPKFISAVAKSAPQWNLDVRALGRMIRDNEQLTEFSKTPLFLLLCCVASKDLLRRDIANHVVVVADVFNLALGRLLDVATDRKGCVKILSNLSLKWWNGEALVIDVEGVHSCGLARTGIVCAADWRQYKEAGGAVQQQLRWSHTCVATYYFALRMMDLLDSDYEEAKKCLTARFDFFVWRILFGLSREKSSVRGQLVKLWIEHHAHLTDRMFERGLFRLPEFEGIEILLWARCCEGRSVTTRRALAQWLMMKGAWRKALVVAPIPDLRESRNWTFELAGDVACVAEIHLKLEDYGSALKLIAPCWNWLEALSADQLTGHWRDFAMVALKLGHCLRAHGEVKAKDFIKIAYGLCWEYIQEFDMRDRILIFEAMDEITKVDGLKELIMQMHALHGEQTHSWANRLVQDGYDHFGRSEMQQARDCFRRAIEIDDLTLDVDDVERAAPWNGLGCTYVMKLRASKEEKNEARKCFEKAAKIWRRSDQRGSPRHARILANLAGVVEPRRGLELMEEAARYDPDCKEYQMLLRLLNRRI